MSNNEKVAILPITSETSEPLLKNSRSLSLKSDSNDGSVITSLTRENYCQLLADTDNLPGCVNDLQVFVDNPKRHGETFETYISYRITVKSSRCDYPEENYVVRRRYSDFEWLRNKLVAAHPTRLIPPTPSKHSLMGQLDRYAKEFITYRMIMLHRFLNRVTKHPVFAYNDSLKLFLTANLTEFIHNKDSTSGILNKVSDGIHNLTVTYHCRDKNSEFEDIKKYISALSEKFIAFDKITCRILKDRKDINLRLRKLSSDFHKWSSVEGGISPVISEIALAYGKIVDVHDEFLVVPVESCLLQPVREYILYVDSVKEALVRRDMIQQQYDISLDELEKNRHEKQLLLVKSEPESKYFTWNSLATREYKLELLTRMTTSLLATVEANHDKLEVGNEDLRSDLERWSVEKRYDIKRILLSMADNYINFYEKSIEIWENAQTAIDTSLPQV